MTAQLDRAGGRALADAAAEAGLGVETVVPTPDGYRTVGELDAGDLVFAGDGRPTRVCAVSEQAMARTCFEVEFSTGERVVAGHDQLWLTNSFLERVHDQKTVAARGEHPPAVAPPTADSSPRSTESLASSLRVHGTTNHAVRVAPGLRLPTDELLPRHPYLVGHWLGAREGTSSKSREADAIPVQYLRASAVQRRELLAGLLDEAGTPGIHGDVVFTATTVRRAWEVHELACTLGYRPRITEGQPRSTATGSHQRTVHVTFVPDRPVFGRAGTNRIVAERAATAGPPDKDRYRHIVRLREVQSQSLRSVTVEAEWGLLLVTRSFIPACCGTAAGGAS